MAIPGQGLPRNIPESVRRKVEVATAMAWEALIEEHTRQALQFITLFDERLVFEEALLRYLKEMDLTETIASAIRTRVLVAMEDGLPTGEPRIHLLQEGDGDGLPDEVEDEDGWRRFRPDLMVRGVFERQKRNEETERFIALAFARAEESIIHTHIDNAITFAALLDAHMSLTRAVQAYLSAIQLSGGRSQSVFQRTMAQLAEVHLPRATPQG
jgi:hypothetical protein